MTSNANSRQWRVAALAGVLALIAMGIAVGKARLSKPATPANAIAQTTFKTPAEAAAALEAAAETDDEKALERILGGDAKNLITTGDTESDKAAMDAFVAKYQRMNRWVDMSDGTRVLYIGADNFAFPVPLAKDSSGQWYFDGVVGAQEIRAREIGRNELLAIDACSALATAQQIYFNSAEGTPEYAQRIISRAGNRDGLYWPMPESQAPSPLGHLSRFASTSLASYQPDQPFIIDGYSFRILTAQGPDARGGARNYIDNGRMTGGFAILATPVKYAETGIMSFMISREGMVYEQDLGPDTIKIASALQEYNPDQNWSLVE